MSADPWPHWLDNIWAKSAAKGVAQGESLAQHTWLVLNRLADLHRLRPDLPQLVNVPKLWHYLFWVCFLHDFGKAAKGFQAMLHGGERWAQRHEVLSLAFVDWIAAWLTEEEQLWVVAGIVSHHRDAKTIAEMYHDLVDPDPLPRMTSELSQDVISGLWHWVDTCAAAWIAALGLDAAGVSTLPLSDHDAVLTLFERQAASSARKRLQQYRRFVAKLAQPSSNRLVPFLTILRGLTTSADHMASAHLERMPAPVQEPWHQFADRVLAPLRIKNPSIEPYEHQKKSAAASGRHALLIAPTGSAKTESALFWALGDGSAPVPRLFYALPYQASMNAMFDRLKANDRGFGAAAVGLQHGRAVQSMYARLLASETWAATAASRAKWEQNINTLNACPIKVFSPYQMLKAMFQLRGFEAILTDYAQAAFIFDEVHAYDPERLALILTLVKYLREGYQARFFVMSATFPQIIRERLAEALGDHAMIEADESVFKKFRRHRLHLLDGELTDPATIERIAGEVRSGRQVLVCANTVRRAQDVRRALTQQGLKDEQVLLIHSRYILKDRSEREGSIRDLCGVEVALNTRKPLALVATQVVEVSLNIDLDTIYTDPAPLEALLQRFGRVNRQCEKGICPVYVFRQPTDGQYVYGRHKDKSQQGHIVRVTLTELERHDGDEIDEAQINGWLDTIYADPLLKQNWQTAYQRIAQQAVQVLASLRPFNSDDAKEEEFERLFDGIDVVPCCYEETYVAHLMGDEFLEANSYLVNISKQKFAILCGQGRVRPAQSEGRRAAWIVDLPYDSDAGLMFDAADRDPDWD